MGRQRSRAVEHSVTRTRYHTTHTCSLRADILECSALLSRSMGALGRKISRNCRLSGDHWGAG